MNQKPDLHGLRVLVVEDDFYIATDTSQWLESAGAEVIGPTGRIEELPHLLERSPNVAVVDINLGRGPSFEVPAMLRERKIPFLFMTGYDQQVIAEDLQDVPRLEKPVRERDLLAAIAALR